MPSPKSLWPCQCIGTSGPTQPRAAVTIVAAASGVAIAERVNHDDLARAGIDGGRIDGPEKSGSARLPSTPKKAT